ncbi:hypothetical protein SAMN04487881_2944 [Marinobacter sp. es.048]|nr:hypothetical protein SAMN04487881_2944 [Marinobacter sp. es.048]
MIRLGIGKRVIGWFMNIRVALPHRVFDHLSLISMLDTLNRLQSRPRTAAIRNHRSDASVSGVVRGRGSNSPSHSTQGLPRYQ